jgi:hypothetical protein
VSQGTRKATIGEIVRSDDLDRDALSLGTAALREKRGIMRVR